MLNVLKLQKTWRRGWHIVIQFCSQDLAFRKSIVSLYFPYSVFLKLIPYVECSKTSNTFLFLFSTKLFVIRAGIPKMLVRTANKEDHDQTASSEAV